MVSISISSTFFYIVLCLLAGAPHTASAEDLHLNSTTLTHWLHDAPKNGTLAEEIQCYSLPYGGIGFASHIITYYTIFILTLQRSPWWPWRKNSSNKIDIFLGVAGLIGTIIISVLTMVRCRARWQFVVIAAWKLDLSITFSCLSIHAAFLLRGDRFSRYEKMYRDNDWDDEAVEATVKILFWLLLYIPGVVAGMVGLISIVIQTISTNHTVLVVTAVFGSITLAVALVGAAIACGWAVLDEWDYESGAKRGFFGSLGAIIAGVAVTMLLFGILGAFYSDWILAAVAGNLAGSPSGDNAALYWSYFILKRFPFLSM